MNSFERVVVGFILTCVVIIGALVTEAIDNTIKMKNKLEQPHITAGVNAGVDMSIERTLTNTDQNAKVSIVENEQFIESASFLEYVYGFTNKGVKLYITPNEDSVVMAELPFNSILYYAQLYDGWCTTRYYDGDEIRDVFIKEEDLMEEECPFTTYDVPAKGGTKTWESYTAIGKNSKQGQLQAMCETNDMGFRMIDGRYTVAIGTRFNAAIGQYVDIVLDNGVLINCVVGDIKASEHTDSTNTFTVVNGTWCCSEFIMDPNVQQSNGNISYYVEDWDSPVVEMLIYEKSVFDEE